MGQDKVEKVSGFRRFIVAAVAMALLVLGLASGYGYLRWRSERGAQHWVDHAHEVIEVTLGLSPRIQATGIAAREVFDHRAPPERYEAALTRLHAQESRLMTLVADDPSQVRRAQAVTAPIDLWTARLDAALAAPAGQRPPVLSPLSNPAYSALLAAAQARSAELVIAEQDLKSRRVADLVERNRLDFAAAMGLILLSVLGLTGLVGALAFGNVRLRAANAEARRSREAERRGAALIEALFSHIPDYLLILDVEPGPVFRVADINPALAAFFEVTREEVRGEDFESLFEPGVAEDLTARFGEIIATGTPAQIRREMISPDGASHLWEATLAPVRDDLGRIRRMVGAVRDITAQVEAETRLRDRQRLESIGQLTGGVAHDFNNLLQVISGNLELLAPLAAGDPVAQRRLDHARQGAERAGRLTAQLLAFARRHPVASEVVDLTRLTENFVDLMRRTLGERVETTAEIEAGLWPVVADPAQIESALLNLALNARDAMAEGGRLSIRLSNITLLPAEAAELELEAGDHVRLTVSDTGQGMDAEAIARAFDPFFTTKPRGKGTGLGLSMVYGFVKQSGGAVRLQSAPDAGTTVQIWLPRSRTPAPAEPAPAGPAPPRGEGRLILVVEDDPEVRAATVALISGLGYACREAADPAEALRLLDDQVALIFSDVLMPGPLSARDFAREVAVRAPGVPLLFTSGYTHDDLPDGPPGHGAARVIAKPFTAQILAARLAELLNGPMAAA